MKRGSNARSSSTRRVSPRPPRAERSAIQKSQALTARIGELGKEGRWQDVLRALETAENNGQKLYVNNFSAAIAALTRNKQSERALQLLQLMQQRQIQPDNVTYTGFIDACSKSGQPQYAVYLLREMQEQGLTANLISCSSTIDACSGSGEWQQAIELFREMQKQHIAPDVTTYQPCDQCMSEWWQLAVSS
jgi:pentatricopeptide repeat protein